MNHDNGERRDLVKRVKEDLDSMTLDELHDVAADVYVHIERLRAMHARLEETNEDPSSA